MTKFQKNRQIVTKCEHEFYSTLCKVCTWVLLNTLLQFHKFFLTLCIFVVFYNVNTVRSEMWVWGFPNHSCQKIPYKSLVFDSWFDKIFGICDLENPILTFPPHSILSLLTNKLLSKTVVRKWWSVFFNILVKFSAKKRASILLCIHLVGPGGIQTCWINSFGCGVKKT